MVNVLAFLAIIPGLLPTDALRNQLHELRQFHREVLHLRFEHDKGVSAASSLLRKMAVKSEGRWWVIKLGTNRPTEKRSTKISNEEPSGSSDVLRSLDHRVWKRQDLNDDADYEPPEGFEEEIESLLQNLSDKVSLLARRGPHTLSKLTHCLKRILLSDTLQRNTLLV
jgi:hypothetical protein